MNKRFIPPLTDSSVQKAQLLQVTILIRHGARTPHTFENCWEGYSTQWDCADTMTTLMVPAAAADSSSQRFLFEKKYDAHPNVLNGSCLKGQLIDEGYTQQTLNGRILRSAYITTDNLNQQLFESTQYQQQLYSNAVRLRVDDEQRTLASGQILLGSLFDIPSEDVVLPLITADFSRDVLTPQEDTCPVLKEIYKQAQSSQEYLQILHSSANKDLLKVFANKTLDWKNPDGDLIDCLMTTYCSDRQDIMPNALWTGGSSSSKEDGVTDDDGSLFSQLFNFFEWKESFHLSYNDAEYSKIGMAPLMAEITELLKPTKECTSLQDVSEKNLTRLHLISGHDSTLMPIMASWNVWNSRWVPYASMLVLESYYVETSSTKESHAFRLIYNGQVITSKFPGCPTDSQLCDLNVFLNHVEPFATRSRDCKVKKDGSVALTKSSLSLKWLIVVTIGSCLLGSLATYFAIRKNSDAIMYYEINRPTLRTDTPNETSRIVA